MQAPLSPPSLSAVLYASSSKSTILLDIPSSLSTPPHLTPRCPHKPLAAPYTLPEPKTQIAFTQELTHTHTRLLPSILAALKDTHSHHHGPYCHPHVQDPNTLSQELDFHIGIPLLQVSNAPEETVTLNESTTFSDISDVLSLPIASSSSNWTTLQISHPYPPKTFHIPPKSSFLLSRFQSSTTAFTALIKEQGQFDLILLDPPWPNRSAARSSAYETLSRFDTKDLLRLPLGRALVYPETHGGGTGDKGGGLVGIWITNKPKFRAFVVETLFPSWGVKVVGEWVWLKVTVGGEPMFALESSVRKPYEVLIFGRKTKSSKSEKKRKREHEEGVAERDISTAGSITKIPAKTILAVPNIHSRKPCIKELIEPYLPSSYRACEIFGRNLTEGWFTWGDEALKFNWEGHWKEVIAHTEATYDSIDKGRNQANI